MRTFRSPSLGMRRIAILAGLLFVLEGCAPRRPAMAERLGPELPYPDVGVLLWVEPTRLAILPPGGSRPRQYARTLETRVYCEGEESYWEALEPGMAVRVHSVRGPFRPLRATAIEVLTPEESDAVREKMLALRGRSAAPFALGPRNLHVSVGRGS